jgi:hypothetical protein
MRNMPHPLMATKALLAALIAVSLSGCSRDIALRVVHSDGRDYFEVFRKDIIGRIGSIPPCINMIVVRDARSGQLAWKAYVAEHESCSKKSVIAYGKLFPDQFIQTPVDELRKGRTYRVYLNTTSGRTSVVFEF